MTVQRCFGNGPNLEDLARYHDEEWGIAEHDDRMLFELLILEGAQAGLSWTTILRKREGYRKLFANFDPKLVAKFTDAKLEKLRGDERIIRNRLKIYAARTNARIFLDIQKSWGSFDNYLWHWVNGKQIVNHNKDIHAMAVSSELSDKISADLKGRGMKFVGSVIIYSYLQATGVIDDHIQACWIRQASKKKSAKVAPSKPTSTKKS